MSADSSRHRARQPVGWRVICRLLSACRQTGLRAVALSALPRCAVSSLATDSSVSLRASQRAERHSSGVAFRQLAGFYLKKRGGTPPFLVDKDQTRRG